MCVRVSHTQKYLAAKKIKNKGLGDFYLYKIRMPNIKETTNSK